MSGCLIANAGLKHIDTPCNCWLDSCLGLPVAAFGSSCNLGLSFVGSAGSESWRGEFNGSGHICVNPL